MTQTTWESNLEHIVKYQLTNHFVTDKQILTELFSKLLSKEKEKMIEEIQKEIDKTNKEASGFDYKYYVTGLEKAINLLQNN